MLFPVRMGTLTIPLRSMIALCLVASLAPDKAFSLIAHPSRALFVQKGLFLFMEITKGVRNVR